MAPDRPRTIGDKAVAAGAWSPGHRTLAGVVFCAWLAALVAYMNWEWVPWRKVTGSGPVRRADYETFLFPCEARRLP